MSYAWQVGGYTDKCNKALVAPPVTPHVHHTKIPTPPTDAFILVLCSMSAVVMEFIEMAGVILLIDCLHESLEAYSYISLVIQPEAYEWREHTYSTLCLDTHWYIPYSFVTP